MVDAVAGTLIKRVSFPDEVIRKPHMKQDAGTIVVFGEALVDDFITEQVVGGAPFNVARNLAAFGALPLMITRIGKDKSGAAILAEFERFALAQGALQIDDAEETGRVVVERSNGEHRFIILPNQAYDHIQAAPALAAAAQVRASTIYFGTLAQRLPTSRGALRQLLRATDAQRYLDLNVREGQVNERCVFESLHEADIVKVNEEELQDLFGWYTHKRRDTQRMDSDDVRGACMALLRIFSLAGLIVTLGPRGSVYFGADGTLIESRPGGSAVRIVDTVGAGDAFSAIWLLGQSLGWPLEMSLVRANEFAAAICGVAGAVPQDTAFYQPWLARWLAD
jgi:fructokinase